MSAVPSEMKRSNSPRVCLFRWLALGLLVCLLWGCGGAVAFDGGTIPPGGGSSRLVGQVFDAEHTSTIVPGAFVTLTDTPSGGMQTTLSTTTDANGNFLFNTSNLTAAANPVSVVVTPPIGSDRAPQHLTFTLQGGVNSTLLIALPSVTFNQNMVASLSIMPPAYQVTSGASTHIGVSLLDPYGDVLPDTPSLLFEGSFGSIQSDGTFTSTGSGAGNVIALWDTTNDTGVGELQSTALVSSGPRLVGAVFDSESSSMAVPNASILLKAALVGGASRTLSAITDANGNFLLDTSQLTAASNQVTVTITPPKGSGRAPQHLTFTLQGGSSATLLVALPSVTFNQSTVASLTLTPTTYQVGGQYGSTTHIGAALLGRAGNVLPMTPSMLFQGGFGYLQPNGLFTSTGSGSGTIIALWDTGNGMGELTSTVAQVVASSSSAPQPPPPPATTTGTSTNSSPSNPGVF